MAITADIQQQVYDLLSRTTDISFVSTEQEIGPRISLTPGQRVSAEVLSLLPNNRTQVRVGSERFNLELPMPVRPGQLLEMTFISEDPRSTFAIARQGGITPPVSLSDASRLLSLLVTSEQTGDPKLRSSLMSIGEMLRRTSGESGVLANLLDEALTYGNVMRQGVKSPPRAPGDFMEQPREEQGTPMQQDGRQLNPEQARLTAFETNAGQILRNIARNSRFILVETANQPVVPLPLNPGEEVDARVIGNLPGGRVFVQVAGTNLELLLPRMVKAGEILRLTVIATQPKPLFAIPRLQPEVNTGELSEAGRWLSVLEHSEGGMSEQQLYVLERLNTVLQSLPPDSPAYTAILDEAITYETLFKARASGEQAARAVTASIANPQPQIQQGNGIVLSDDMARLLQAIIKGNRLALLEALGQQGGPSGLLPGQQLRGDVLAAIGGGRFLLQVADQILEFAMPKGTRRNDRVTLFFITDEPHATFLMTRFGKPGDSVVSETGRWLSGFIESARERVPVGETLGILQTLLLGPPEDADQLSRALQAGLRDSGLFYESHLARWFDGAYSLEDILKEPQARLSPRFQAHGGNLPMEVNSEQLARASMRTGSAEIMEAMLHRAGNNMAHEGIADQRTLPVVNEQLTALQQSYVAIRGDLFPGQQIDWRVAERESGRDRSGKQHNSWESELALDLPRLGAVAIRLSLAGSRIEVLVTAEKSGTAVSLESTRGQLQERLLTAGFSAAEVGIRSDETQ